jgi:hypothetical protein
VLAASTTETLLDTYECESPPDPTEQLINSLQELIAGRVKTMYENWADAHPIELSPISLNVGQTTTVTPDIADFVRDAGAIEMTISLTSEVNNPFQLTRNIQLQTLTTTITQGLANVHVMLVCIDLQSDNSAIATVKLVSPVKAVRSSPCSQPATFEVQGVAQGSTKIRGVLHLRQKKSKRSTRPARPASAVDVSQVGQMRMCAD